MRVKFADVLEIRNGKNQRKVENPQGKYPIYGSGGVMGYADDYICDAETVVIGRKGSINNPIFVNEPFWNVDTAFGLVANRQLLLPKYLYYFCVNYDFEKLNTTVTIPSLTKANLFQISIDVPELNQQGAVVEKLDKIEDIISIRKQQLSTLDELVKARFVEMFGDPIYNPMCWTTRRLDEVCNGIGDGLHGTPQYADDGQYPFINGNNLIDGTIVITPATKSVNENTYKKHYIDISRNAILISINGTLGKLAFYRGESVMLGKSACYCNLHDDINRVFVYWLMKMDSFANYLDANSTKSTIKNVGLKAMRDFLLILPPMDLQTQFAAFVQATDQTKSTIQASLDELETLKKSLMQEYFG